MHAKYWSGRKWELNVSSINGGEFLE